MGIEVGLGAAILGGALGANTVYGMYSANKASQDQRSAQRAAQRNAEATAKASDEANNRANQKSPNVLGALGAAMMSGKGGVSGTMLTGSQGVDPGALSLGRSTLLGG